MYVTKEKIIGVWIQLWCISCLYVSLIGQIEKGASTVDKVNSISLGLFFLNRNSVFVSICILLSFLGMFFSESKLRTHKPI
jgi:hypothetical protein